MKIRALLYVVGMFFFFQTSPFTIDTFIAGSINGTLYPAQCGLATGKPLWCSGSTPDAWIRSACTALTSGGDINLAQLTGNLAASATCSTPTKQINTYVATSTN